MTFEQIIESIKTLGVPVGVLAYVLWRGDKFLQYFVGKLDKFNDELQEITFAIRDLIHTVKNGKG